MIPHGIDPAEWLNIKQAEKHLGLSQYRFYTIMHDSRYVAPECFIYGQRVYFLAHELDEWNKVYGVFYKCKRKKKG